MDSLEYANALYEQYKKSKPQTIEEILSQKYAKDKKEYDEIIKKGQARLNKVKTGQRKKYSCLKYIGNKQYESFEKEQEYFEDFRK